MTHDNSLSVSVSILTHSSLSAWKASGQHSTTILVFAHVRYRQFQRQPAHLSSQHLVDEHAIRPPVDWLAVRFVDDNLQKVAEQTDRQLRSIGGGQTTALHAAWRSSEMTWKQMAAKNNCNLSSGRETSSGGGRAAQCRGSQSVLSDVPLWLQLYIYILLGLPDRLKFFQGSFVVLWLLKFYFMPILNAFWIYWRSKFFQTNIYE